MATKTKEPPKPKAPKESPIKFPATVSGVKTLADGRVTLTLAADPSQLTKVISVLSIKQDGDTLDVTITRVKAKPKEKNGKDKKSSKKRKAKTEQYPYRKSTA